MKPSIGNSTGSSQSITPSLLINHYNHSILPKPIFCCQNCCICLRFCCSGLVSFAHQVPYQPGLQPHSKLQEEWLTSRRQQCPYCIYRTGLGSSGKAPPESPALHKSLVAGSTRGSTQYLSWLLRPNSRLLCANYRRIHLQER